MGQTQLISIVMACVCVLAAGCGEKEPASVEAAPVSASQVEPSIAPAPEPQVQQPEIIEQGASQTKQDEPETVEAPEGDTIVPGVLPVPITKLAPIEPVATGPGDVFVDLALLDVTGLLADEAASGALIDFLRPAETPTLDPPASAGLLELLRGFETDGLVAFLTRPKVLVRSGGQARIEISQALPGFGKSSAAIEVTPTVVPSAGDEAATVRVEYEFELGEPSGRLALMAAAIGLDLGSSSEAAGAFVIDGGDTFWVLRRLDLDGDSRDLLLLVTPTVLPGPVDK